MKISNKEIVFLLIGFYYLIFVFLANQRIPQNIGVMGAMQILDGSTPYLNFWTYYAPGVFYFNALIISICSNVLLSVRFVYLLLSYSISVIIYFLAKEYVIVGSVYSTENSDTAGNTKFFPMTIAFIPFFVSIIWQGFYPFSGESALLGVVLILFSAISLFRYYDKMNRQNSTLVGILPMGICIGLLGLVRQDMASYMYGLFFWAMFWAGMADVEGLGLSLWKRAVRGFVQGVFFTIIAILAFAPLATYFIANCGAENIYQQVIVFPFQHYRELNALPLPDPLHFLNFDYITEANIFYYIINSWKGIIFYFPILAALVALLLLIYKVRKKICRANTPRFWKEMLIINLTLNIFNYALICPDIKHLTPSLIFASMLLPNIIAMLGNKVLKSILIAIIVIIIVELPLILTFREY